LQDRASFGLPKTTSRYGERLACVENLDSDLVSARGLYLDIFDFEWLAGTPAHCSLAFYDLSCSLRHDSSDVVDRVRLKHFGFQPQWLPLGIWEFHGKAGPSPSNVLPKRLLQACKSLSHIHTTIIHGSSPKIKVFFFSNSPPPM
jgi:hypothetical protein